MSDCIDVHDFASVVDGVKNAVVADTNAPEIAGALQLQASRRARIFRERLDFWKDAVHDSRMEAFEVFSGGAGKCDGELSHSVSRL